MCWRCSNGKCNKKLSIREGSWFSKSKHLLEQIVKLTYYWVYKCPADFVTRELRIGSERTLVDWYNFSREVCVEIIQRDSERIGGDGKEVEFDESKFGKRKYHRGRRWMVYGSLEVLKDRVRSVFSQIVVERSALTLIPIIQKYIKPGPVILSDCWKAYRSLKDEGYTHLTVNHSIEFKNKETGACTNLIESIWNAVKKSFLKTGSQKQLYDSYLAGYCIRKKYLNDIQDKFSVFLELIKKVYPGKRGEVLQPVSVNSPVSKRPQTPPFNSSMDLFD